MDSAYRHAAKDLMRLNGLSTQRHRWARIVAEEDKLVINVKPRLLIGEFDVDQKHGDIWKSHLNRLETMLPEKTVRARGTGKGLRLDAGGGPRA